MSYYSSSRSLYATLVYTRRGMPAAAAVRSLTGILGVCLLACLLNGCLGGGSNAVRYYVIDPAGDSAGMESPGKPLAIEITDLHIPQYLERFQIVTRDGDNQLHLSENNQWGENLRKNLMRTLAQNLSVRLHTIDVGTPLNRSASTPDYRLQVYITRFERGVDGVVRLDASWQVSAESAQVLGTYSSNLDSGSAVAGKDYTAIVTSMQDLYARLCAKIADTLIEKEK